MNKFFSFIIVSSLLFSGCIEKTPEYFYEIPCETEKCIEEKNGFFWAKKNKINNEKDCDIDFSEAFYNGCKIFSQESVKYTPLPTNTEGIEFIKVKYRQNGAINILEDYFQEIENTDSTIRNAWYDSENLFLLIQIKKTVYQYCNVSEDIWNILNTHKTPYIPYQEYIRGRFDCREFGEIIYE